MAKASVLHCRTGEGPSLRGTLWDMHSGLLVRPGLGPPAHRRAGTA